MGDIWGRIRILKAKFRGFYEKLLSFREYFCSVTNREVKVGSEYTPMVMSDSATMF